MSAKIINSHRYKKTTRKKANIKKEQKYKYLNSKKKNDLKYIKQKKKKEKKMLNIESSRLNESKNNVNNLLGIDRTLRGSNIYIPKSFLIICLVLCIVIIAFISKKIVKVEESPIVKVFSNKDDVSKKFVKDYDLKVGISELDTTDLLTSKNVVLKELEKFTTKRLIKVDSNYKIEYVGAKTIDKISNKEYNVLLNDKSNISILDIKNSVDKIKNTKNNSIYYKYINNVESIEEISKKQFKIKLLKDDPYFVYVLDFPIYSSDENYEYKVGSLDGSNILFERYNSKSTIKSINLENYNDTDKMVEAFRDSKIDVFFASSNNAMQLIGKHESNIKKYRNGETIFILGNKNSKIYSKKEIRKAIVYSLNREEIVREVNSNYGEIIDLPFIYSNIKYKYDIYGASNVLLANSWEKDSDGIFKKEEDENVIRAEINLLVNSEDASKMKIAEKIKDMCYKSGVLINIQSLSQDEISNKVQNKDYDIVLADVLIDNIPDTLYLEEYLNINEETNNALLQVSSSNIENLQTNIENLQNVLSEEVACIGILARNINVVYQKDITGFDNIRYFNIFENIENIGKLNDRIGD